MTYLWDTPYSTLETFLYIFQTLPNSVTAEAVGKSSEAILRAVVSKLNSRPPCLEQQVGPQERLCWAIVSDCCSQMAKFIDSHLTFKWIMLYSDLILQLAKVYRLIVESAGGVKPDYPHSHADGYIKNYFDWVNKVYLILGEWYSKIHSGAFSYSDLLQYQTYHSYCNDVANMLCAKDLVVPMAKLTSIKGCYEELFKQVNFHLIKHNREGKWCTLPQILQEYGVHFPSEFLKDLILPAENADLLVPLNISQVPNESMVQARQSLTFRILELLVSQLTAYVQPILGQMETLVLFYLSHNGIFKSYVFLQLDIESCKKVRAIAYILCHIFIFFKMQPQVCANPLPDDLTWSYQRDVSMSDLGNALNKAILLLARVSTGKAAYIETIASGRLLLETLDIETECRAITNHFCPVKCLPQVPEMANMFSSMLELFQYACIYIPTIHQVCELYRLNGCIQDPRLTQLKEIADELHPQGEKVKLLLPLEATGILKHVKELFCFKIPKVCPIGLLFSNIARSNKIHQFFCEHGFDAWQLDKDRFDMLCSSIRAQLEHRMAMIDHLCAGYPLMAPFMDTEQDFQCLLTRVAGLDVLQGLESLGILSSNIEDISLWFPETKVIECVFVCNYSQT